VIALWLAAPPEAPVDARRLARLAAWCRRFSPWTAPFRGHGPGIWIESTGCDHLFGGEDAMCRRILTRLQRGGITARAGLAGTPGAAWALALATADGNNATVCPPGGERAALAALPIAALRLDPDSVDRLSALGLRRIGDLYPLNDDARGRAGLARRFPPLVLERLDAALGRTFEPISPLRPRAAHITRFEPAAPVHDGDGAAVARIAARLAAALAPMLARDGLGARRIALAAFRSDGRRVRQVIGTARPLADASAMTALLRLALDHHSLDLGPGADGFTLEALCTEPLRRHQPRLALSRPAEAASDADITLAPLVERLAGRLGPERVGRLTPRPHHLPERAQGFTPALDQGDDAAPFRRPLALAPLARHRPLRLLARPLPVTTPDPSPDGPPEWFQWQGRRHLTAQAEGPERIALDWWRLPGWQIGGAPAGLADAVRDYWRIEDREGARFWLFRAGPPRPGPGARWYLHGVFT
jgi:protein ImuB